MPRIGIPFKAETDITIQRNRSLNRLDCAASPAGAVNVLDLGCFESDVNRYRRTIIVTVAPCSEEDRLHKARASLETARKIGLSLPVDIENGPARRSALAEKFA